MRKKKKQVVYALHRHIPLSPDKARRVIDQIRGQSCEKALRILQFMRYRACYPILKLVHSAAANANQKMDLNRDIMRFDKANFVISHAEVNKGPTKKKGKPRARGRCYQIKRRTCHIIIGVKEKDGVRRDFVEQKKKEFEQYPVFFSDKKVSEKSEPQCTKDILERIFLQSLYPVLFKPSKKNTEVWVKK